MEFTVGVGKSDFEAIRSTGSYVAFYRKQAMVRLAGNLPEGLLQGDLPRFLP